MNATLEKPKTKATSTGNLPHFSVERDALVSELSIVAGAVSKRSTIPVLGNVLISAADGSLSIIATDVDMTIHSQLPSLIKRPGQSTLPALKLLEYVRLLPIGGDIDFEFDENYWAVLKKAKSRIRIAGLDARGFPSTLDQDVRTLCDIAVGDLMRLISQTSYAILDVQTSYTIPFALFEVGGGNARMVALDGHRLSVSECVVKTEEAFAVFIPIRAVREIKRLADAAPAVSMARFSENDSQVSVDFGQRELRYQKPVGNFPDYNRVVSQEKNSAIGSFSVSKELLREATERCRCFSADLSRRTELTISGAQVELSSKSPDAGESHECVEIETEGKAESTFGLNSRYLLDALKSISGDYAKVHFGDGFRPVRVRDRDREDFYSIIMPVR